MENRLHLREMILATSVAINLIFTAIVVYFHMTYPFNMDLIRVQYLEDVRYFYGRGCLTGTDYPQEYRQSVPGFNHNSPNNWCNKEKQDIDDLFLNNMYRLGKKKL